MSLDFLVQQYLQSSEVDNAVDVGMRSKDFVQCLLICNIDFVEVWSLAAEKLDAIEGDFGGVVQAVDDHDLVAMLEEGQRGEGPNVAGTSVRLNISVASRACRRNDGGADQSPALPSGGSSGDSSALVPQDSHLPGD
jgi:hypothetical protein